MDMESLDERREILCLNFALKSSKNPKCQHMFPKNEKDHLMDTRAAEKFKVQHTHRKRLQISPIIFMQNQLNELEKSKS